MSVCESIDQKNIRHRRCVSLIDHVMTCQKLLSFTIKEHVQHNLMAELTGGRCYHANAA